MTTRSVTLAALLAALGRPAWWILALAGFLIRGGILVFGLAIVALPSPLALSNVLRPIITPLYFGRLEPTTAALIAAAVATVVVWIIGGGWVAAATEVVLVRDAQASAIEESLPARPPRTPGSLVVTRAAAAHFLALVPMVLAVAIGSIQIVNVTYSELVSPTDASPIAFRVIAGAAVPVVVIVILWLLGEIVGGAAVRRIVLGGEGIASAVRRAALDLVRHPGGALIAPLVAIAVLVVDLGAVLGIVVLVWSEVRERLVHPLQEPVATALALATLGAAWCLALLVTGLIGAWRSAAMTLEAERSAVAGGAVAYAEPVAGGVEATPVDGTIGASARRRPGDWSHDDPGGSL